MDATIIQCRYCRVELIVRTSTSNFRCPRCHNLYTETITTGVTNKTWKDNARPSECKAQPNASETALSSTIHACPTSFPERRPRKRALICGVSYMMQRYKLRGTLTDAYNMKDLLMNCYHFPENAIELLTEEGDQHRMPTKENMEKGLKWLVQGCTAGDSLVFYFSGHGLRQPDFENDELDGFDESLCPVDFKTKGLILDNDINAMIVRPLIHGVTLHAIIDACYSGTILDLEYLYSLKQRRWVDNRPPSGAKKCSKGGRAICFSACREDQMATDSNALTKKGMRGVMTHCFIQAIQNKPKLTYFELLSSVQEAIAKTFASRCLSSKLIDKLLHRKLSQDPQLSSTEVFDVEKTDFML